jgi:hypothetical protein
MRADNGDDMRTMPLLRVELLLSIKRTRNRAKTAEFQRHFAKNSPEMGGLAPKT